MALSAWHGAMRPGKHKRSFRMIKSRQVPPSADVVAPLTAGWRTAGARRLEALLELPLVRIPVAAGASKIGKPEAPTLISPLRGGVAVATRNRQMRTLERKMCFPVLCQ
jgi:hypothetical protein